MSDTPRTDAFYDALYDASVPQDLRDAVDAKEKEFARKLERELAETKRLLAEARDTLSHGMVFFLTREKMHETGIALAQDLITRIDAAIKEQK